MSDLSMNAKKTHHHSFYSFHRSRILLFFTTFLIQINISTPVVHHISLDSDGFNHYRQLFTYNGDTLATEPWIMFENPRLENAYIALQAWKQVMISDPNNMTASWVGPDVCNYAGVSCWPAPDNKCERTVAGIDINHANIAGHLPHELGLLYDLTLFHLNSNRFCGTIPSSFSNLKLLFELDLSNNRFAGKFPEMVLHLPRLRYLDIRYNEFEGALPMELFERSYDAIFINNNRFSSALPDNIGNSPVSVLVLANNKFEGCFPTGLGKMRETLNELVLTNIGFFSCLPNEVGLLKNLTVLDVSNNKIMGPLPYSIGDMESLEQLNVGHNMLSGKIFQRICKLPNLKSFGYDYNFFSDESPDCLKVPEFDDRTNCFKGRPKQRSTLQCQRFRSKHVDCSSFHCGNYLPPIPFPPSPSQLPPIAPPSPLPPSSPLQFSPPPPIHHPPPTPSVSPPTTPQSPPACTPPLQPKTPPPPSNCTCQTPPSPSQPQKNF